MKKIFALFALTAALTGLSTGAGATPVLIGEIFHDYGSASGKLDPGGNDPLSADYVTVKDNSTSRFNDVFDFSTFDYTSIDHFEVTLNFTQTNGSFESWRARPGASTSLPALSKVGDVLTSQTFSFGPSTDTFASFLSTEKFNLWFAEEGFGTNDFRLFDAKVSVFGTAATVPEPGTLGMLFLGIAMMVLTSRRRC
ncbi:PEP-CTERM sorting domain-containing protein [Uliginosibacterium sp. H3]|uniref:PEP-CTERM sorting domain-containing protein n=1 Tax=Uliginosibacterium silvisoli TaxID=3114758 RepID=A0ABU6JZP7_9RHOO|nr:PEP-CTERM sorting domain-containing protein [Uliginosibacterium sp. H3]MEC5384686.1 PEP-CTERM sorting domain-containing protein [Uliginosibacterium sp. H3]